MGEVVPAPLEIMISKEPLRTRQADLLFISHARMSIAKDQIEGPPDLLVEILSPGHTRTALQPKLKDYSGFGVREVWVVDRQAQNVEVLTLEKGKYRSAGINAPGSPVNTKVLAGFVLPKDAFA
jgi:Uma2 family endonuclease